MATWSQIYASPSSAAVEFNSNSDLGSCGSANAVLLTLDRLSIKQATVDISNNNNSNSGSIAFQEVTPTPATTATVATILPQQTAGLSSTTPT